MTDRTRPEFEERIRHALAQFPGAIPGDDAEAGPRRELVVLEDVDALPHQVWPPQPHPPTDYPDDIPFVAHARTLIVRRPDPARITMVVWSDVPQGELVLDDVIAASLREGWATVEPTVRTVECPHPGRQLTREREARFIWSLTIKGRVEVCLMQVPRTREAV
jgi:hypothetical protein